MATTGEGHIKYLRCFKSYGCPSAYCGMLNCDLVFKVKPPPTLSLVDVHSLPLRTPDQSVKGMFLVC